MDLDRFFKLRLVIILNLFKIDPIINLNFYDLNYIIFKM